MNNSDKKGYLIVITGPDGCGKKTQTELLVKRFKSSGHKTETIDFPQYKKNFFGQMVGRYLAREFGDPARFNPYLASILYAEDRFESMEQIKEWLNDGKIVVCDRYVGDNFLHQGGKIKDKEKREVFFAWLEQLEYSVCKAQKSHRTFYLDVPLKISLKLLEEKDAKTRKDYSGGEKDGHENEKHLREVRAIADELIKKFYWIKIDCAPKGIILPKEKIAEIIWRRLIED